MNMLSFFQLSSQAGLGVLANGMPPLHHPLGKSSYKVLVAWVVLFALLACIVVFFMSRGPLRRRTIALTWVAGTCGFFGLLTVEFFRPNPYVFAIGPRRVSMHRLGNLGHAMQSYADRNEKRFPSAAIWDKDGHPLLSWRVLLLPDLGKKELFAEFHLDEPWDSPHNLALLPLMPRDYESPDDVHHKTEPFTTFYQVFVGEGTAFEGKKGLRFPEDFPKGDSKTILIVEAGKAVPWTKPEDLVYEPNQPLPPLGGIFGDRKSTKGWDIDSEIEVIGWGALLAAGPKEILKPTTVVGPEVNDATIRDMIIRKAGK
jgi:Protein of unknown function (DUF1559)